MWYVECNKRRGHSAQRTSLSDSSTNIHVSYSVGCNTRYTPETHLKPKSREIAFARNLLLSCQIVLKFCTEHDSITVVLCAKFQHDLTTRMDVMDKRHFTKFEFRTDILYCNGRLVTTYIRLSNIFDRLSHRITYATRSRYGRPPVCLFFTSA